MNDINMKFLNFSYCLYDFSAAIFESWIHTKTEIYGFMHTSITVYVHLISSSIMDMRCLLICIHIYTGMHESINFIFIWTHKSNMTAEKSYEQLLEIQKLPVDVIHRNLVTRIATLTIQCINAVNTLSFQLVNPLASLAFPPVWGHLDCHQNT